MRAAIAWIVAILFTPVAAAGGVEQLPPPELPPVCLYPPNPFHSCQSEPSAEPVVEAVCEITSPVVWACIRP